MSFGAGFAMAAALFGNGGGGEPTSDKWTRPSDWPQLGTPADNQIIMLVTTQWNMFPYESFDVYSYANGGTSTPFGEGKVITVDWGDGTIESLEPWYENTSANFGHYFYTNHSDGPPTWNDGPVLNNGAHVFVITITLPDGIYFDYGRNCELLDVHIGANVKFAYGLSQCHMLEHIKLFGWLPNDDNYVSGQFAYNWALCSVETTIPFTEITDNMFGYCCLLHEIDLSQCVTIGDYAFNSCMMEKINAPLLEAIGERAFTASYKLITVESPKLSSVGNYAFGACYSLMNISHVDGWTLGTQAFSNCYKYYDNPNKSHPNYA